MRYFLITYDAVHEQILEIETYDDGDVAEREYSSAERACHDEGRSGVQVVLFSADSLESVEGTHPHYFRGRTDTMGFAALSSA